MFSEGAAPDREGVVSTTGNRSSVAGALACHGSTNNKHDELGSTVL
jgi:hypothetical protein